jgi:hypothetical protein
LTFTLDNYDDVTEKKLVTFKFDGDTYRQNKYALMLLDVIKLLDKQLPGKLLKLALENYSINITSRKHPHLSTTSENMRWGWEITDGIYMEANLSAWLCIRFIKNLMSEYSIDKSLFSFNVIAEEDDDDNDEDE